MVERDGPSAEAGGSEPAESTAVDEVEAGIPTLAEEEAEVIAFDSDEDLDVETMAVDEDDLFDPVAVDAVSGSQPYFDDVTAVDAVVQADADGAGVEQTERPLKTQVGG